MSRGLPTDKHRELAYTFINPIYQDASVVIKQAHTHAPVFGDIVCITAGKRQAECDVPRWSNLNMRDAPGLSQRVPLLSKQTVEVGVGHKRIKMLPMDILLSAAKLRNTNDLLVAVQSLEAAEGDKFDLRAAAWSGTFTSNHTTFVSVDGSVKIDPGTAYLTAGLNGAFHFKQNRQHAAEYTDGVELDWFDHEKWVPSASDDIQQWLFDRLSPHVTWGYVTTLYYVSHAAWHSGAKSTWSWSVGAEVNAANRAAIKAQFGSGEEENKTIAETAGPVLAAYCIQELDIPLGNTVFDVPSCLPWCRPAAADFVLLRQRERRKPRPAGAAGAGVGRGTGGVAAAGDDDGYERYGPPVDPVRPGFLKRAKQTHDRSRR